MRRMNSIKGTGGAHGSNWQRTGAVALVLTMALATVPAWWPASADHGTYTAPDPLFVDIADDTGLDFSCDHWNKNLGLAPRWFIDILFCASPVLADFNGDGYTDVFFPNTRYTYTSVNDQFGNPTDQLYLNNGDGTFTDVTDFVGIADEGYSGGAAAVDYDNDGDLDIYVANFPNRNSWYPGLGGNSFDSPATDFYVNNGDGTFTHATPPGLMTRPNFGRLDNQMGQGVAVADYDGDGNLDIYRGNYIKYRLPDAMPSGLQLTVPDSNNLFRNNGDGTFADVTFAAGASLYSGRTFAVNFVDMDGDMLPDIYVANDENPNELYINDGDGTFTENAAGAGVDDGRGSMCAEAQDFDGDGRLDLYMSHFENEYNGYYRSSGPGTWTEASTEGDLGMSYEILGWACPGWDYDNDGDLDLFVANGHMLPIGGQFPGGDDGYELPNFLFRNRLVEDGVHSFEDVRDGSGAPVTDRYASSGAMPIDIDLDGVLELILIENNKEPTKVLSNTAGVDGHWLSVELRQAGGNIYGIGAKVEVTSGGHTQTRYMMTGNTLASGSVAPLHFGLGASDDPATIDVTWPDGSADVYVVGVDQPVRLHKAGSVQLDTLAPKVDLTISGTLGSNGWYTSPVVQVDLTATERGIGAQSGVTALSYKLDGGPVTPYGGGSIAVSGEGLHKLTVFAEDGAGNKAWYPTTFKIDSEAPALSPQSPIMGKVYFQDRVVDDSIDGQTYIVAPVHTPNEDVALVDERIAGLQWELEDRYGIPTPASPATGEGALDDTVGSDGRTTVAVAAADTTSGVVDVTFALDGVDMRTDGYAPYDWRADLRGATLGVHTITCTVVDEAGHTTTTDLEVFVIPTTQDGALNTVMDLIGGL